MVTAEFRAAVAARALDGIGHEPVHVSVETNLPCKGDLIDL